METSQEGLACNSADGDAAACASLGERCVFDENSQRCESVRVRLQSALAYASQASTSLEQQVAFNQVAELAEEGHAAALDADPANTSFIDQITSAIGGAMGNVVKLGILVGAASAHPELLTFLKQENVIAMSADGELMLSAYVTDFCLVDDANDDVAMSGGALNFQFDPLPEVDPVDLDKLFGLAPVVPKVEQVQIDFTKPLSPKTIKSLFGRKLVDRFQRVLERGFKILEGLLPNRASLAAGIQSVFMTLTKFFQRLGFTSVPSLSQLWQKLSRQSSTEPSEQKEGEQSPGEQKEGEQTLSEQNADKDEWDSFWDIKGGFVGDTLVLLRLAGVDFQVLYNLTAIYAVANSFAGAFLFRFATFLFQKAYKKLEEHKLVPVVDEKSEFKNWDKMWNIGKLVLQKVVGAVVGTLTFTVATIGKLIWAAIKAVASVFPWIAKKLRFNLQKTISESSEKAFEKAREAADNHLEDRASILANTWNAFRALSIVSSQEPVQPSTPSLMKLKRNAVLALQTPDDEGPGHNLWRMLRENTAVKGPISLTYHTNGKRAVCVIGEVHMPSTLMYGPRDTYTLDIQEFLLSWLKHSGVFIDLFLEVEGYEFTHSSRTPLYLDKLRQVFSPCFTGKFGECATSRTARVHAADPPSVERTMLDPLMDTFYSPDTTYRSKWMATVTFYSHYSPTLGQLLEEEDRTDASSKTDTITNEIVRKFANDFFQTQSAPRSSNDLRTRNTKVAGYLRNIDPQYSKTFNSTLLTTAATIAGQVTQALVDALERNENDLLVKLFNNAFVLANFYMDAYLLARMFKPFEVQNSVQPEYAYNSVVYAGNNHSNTCRAMLRALGFTETVRLQSPSCNCNDCERDRPCQEAQRNMTLVLEPEQSKVLLTFHKPE